MPNQNFREPHDDMKIMDCDLKSNKGCQPSENICRFAYASWCPVCDLDSHRRRSKSESTEAINIRKRSREMKTPSPRKNDRYAENKEFYDVRDVKLESSRVRTNLCELPTSYIASNCQNNVPSSIHEKSHQSKLCNGTNSEFYMQHGPLCIKPFSSDYAEYHSDLLSSHKSSPDKIINLKQGDKFSGVQRYLSLSSKLSNSIDNDWKQTNFVKNTYMLPEKRCVSAPKSVRELPLPHKHRTTSNNQTEVDKYVDDYYCTLKCPLSADRITDREKLLSRNNCCINHETVNLIQKNSTPIRLLAPDPLKSKETSKKLISNGKLNLENKSTDVLEKINNKVMIIKENLHTDLKVEKNLLYETKLVDLKRQRIRQSSDSDNQNGVAQPDLDNKAKVNVKKARDVRQKSVRVASLKTRSKLNAVKLRKVRNKIAHSVSSDSNFSDSDTCETEDDSTEASEPIKEVFSRPISPPSGATPVNGFTLVTPPTSDLGKWPVRKSLFPYVPPYISFSTHDSDVFVLPPGAGKYLRWKLSTITPVVVRKTLQNTGFRMVKSESDTKDSNDWIGTWGKHMKSNCFQGLKESQKLNHFPGTFQIGRKDRLWKNLQKLMLKYGQKEFGFIPRTFVLPHDLKLLRQSWEKTGHEKWIIKPPASARGTGIKVIHRWAHLPKKRSLVVQQYISNPYLINGSKFDLRLYVLVTSFNPLRIYLYPDGLARFASTKYSDDLNSLSDRYMHLTNYSINKLSSQYTANEDANACKGHKWTISKLWEYMEKEGIHTKSLWCNLQQLVIKTILCGESSISQLIKANLSNRYNCYELFGIDVLLDESLTPWLLEVNISPSLHSASPLDLHVKGPLVQTLLNLAQFHLPVKLNRIRKSPPCLNIDLYSTQMTSQERMKQLTYTTCKSREEYLSDILEELTSDDVRHLIQAEDELTVIGNFERVFPTSRTYYYLQFMETRYYNRLFDAWEHKYEKNRTPGIKLLQKLCEKKLHLMVAPTPAVQDSQNEMDGESSAGPSIANDINAASISKRLQVTSASFNTDAA